MSLPPLALTNPSLNCADVHGLAAINIHPASVDVSFFQIEPLKDTSLFLADIHNAGKAFQAYFSVPHFVQGLYTIRNVLHHKNNKGNEFHGKNY